MIFEIYFPPLLSSPVLHCPLCLICSQRVELSTSLAAVSQSSVSNHHCWMGSQSLVEITKLHNHPDIERGPEALLGFLFIYIYQGADSVKIKS